MDHKDKLLCEGRPDGNLVGLVDWLLHFTSGDRTGRSALSVKRAQLGSSVMSKLFQPDFALRNSEPYDSCDGRSFPPVFVGGQKWVWPVGDDSLAPAENEFRHMTSQPKKIQNQICGRE